MAFFDGFTLTRVAVPDGNIRVYQGGSGLLLLHGNPQSHCIRPARQTLGRFPVPLLPRL
jgi:hypothetical protein